jgi:hypothetical protein
VIFDFVMEFLSTSYTVYTVYTDFGMLASDSVFLETAMHAHHVEPHYAPSSVGALMDPVFLRGAVIDANGGHRAEGASPPRLWLRWRRAIRAIATACRRH